MNTDMQIAPYNAGKCYMIVYFRHSYTTIQQMHRNESISLSSAYICPAAAGPEGVVAAPLHLSSNSSPPTLPKMCKDHSLQHPVEMSKIISTVFSFPEVCDRPGLTPLTAICRVIVKSCLLTPLLNYPPHALANYSSK